MRHEEATVYHGRQVIVAMGWDRPLSGWFMTITSDDDDNPDADPETGVIYSNLDDEALPFPGLAKSVDHYKKVLRHMGITMSPNFIGTVLAVCD